MRLERVETVENALSRLADLGEDAQLIAGGTDVMIQLARGQLTPEVLIPIHRLPGLSDVDVNGTVRVGALVTHETVAGGALGAGFAGLGEAAATVGGWQTQTVGTIVGNLCNASPAADTVPPLIVHDAQVCLRSAAGERKVSIDDFLVGRRQTSRRPDEMVTAIELGAPEPNSGDVYLKVGRRGAMEVAIVGLAMRLVFGEGARVATARIAVASVGAKPTRSTAAEVRLQGKEVNPETAAEVAGAILANIDPIDDLRASARYRRQLIPGLTRRALIRCANRASVDIELEEVPA